MTCRAARDVTSMSGSAHVSLADRLARAAAERVYASVMTAVRMPHATVTIEADDPVLVETAAAIRAALTEAARTLRAMPSYGTVPFVARDDAAAAIEAL